MALPKQVVEQAEAAERMATEAGLKGAPPKPEPVENGDKPNTDKPAEKTEKIDPDDYKARFAGLTKTHSELKQRYEASQAEVSRLTGTVEALQKQNADLLEQVKAAPEVTPQPSVDTGASVQERIMAVLSDDEKSSYSQEFFDMLGRVLQTVSPSKPETDSELKERLEKVEKNQHLTAEEAFWKKVNEAVPDWRDIQDTDAFQAYLKEHDPLLQDTRLNVLVGSQETLNASRAIAVFNDFKNRAHILGPQVEDDTEIDPLERHVIPDDTGAGDGGDIETTPDISPDEITQFYQDVALGKYKNRLEEQRAMEAAIAKILKQSNQQ